jgi:hypothetical protein
MDVWYSPGVPTSAAEQQSKEVFQIYPNPSNGLFFVKFQNELSGIYDLKVVDLLGRVVVTESFNHDQLSLRRMDLNIESGVYLVSLFGEEGLISLKLSVR